MAVNDQGDRSPDAQGKTEPLLRIWTLGPLAIEWSAGTFPPERMRGRDSARALGLLKALLSQADRFATRDWLMEQFWPDSPITSAKERLDDVASGLRTLLRPPGSSDKILHYVHGSDGRGSGYRLEGYPRLWVDADAFGWTIEQACRLDRFTEDSLPLWEQAYHLGARGPFLPEERYSDWAQARRELLAGDYRQCVHRLASILRERGANEQALLRLRTYWQTHPTDEDILRPLMELLGEQERYQEAEDCYQHLLRVLAEEESPCEPDAHTQDIREYLRAKQTRRERGATRATQVTPGGVPRETLTSPILPADGQSSASSTEDIREAPSPEQFYGRETELITLNSWILKEHCRLVAILGMGGIGKTSLAVRFTHHAKASFTYVFWRSLQHAPRLSSLLKECLAFLSNYQHIDFPSSTDDLISLLLQRFQEHRCLFLLDNCETLLQSGLRPGSYREGYQEYGTFFQRLGEIPHQSCLLFTSREKTNEVSRLEGIHASVRSLPLSGLGLAEAREILKDKGILCAAENCYELVRLYGGNPLALKLVAEPIRELFNANIALFLQEEHAVVSDVYNLLEQQFTRLSMHERAVIYWLAIEREPVSLEAIWAESESFASKKELLDALTSLRRRSMIETHPTLGFALPPVILEYITDTFIQKISEEIFAEVTELLTSHALMKAQSKEYIREAQMRLIVLPIVERLRSRIGKGKVEEKLKAILSRLQQENPRELSYAAGNLLNLLISMRSDLRGYDFSHLHIRQAFLQRAQLPDVTFEHADFESSVFTDTFGSIFSVAFDTTGTLLAAGTASGEVRLWDTVSSMPLQTFQGHTDWVRSIVFSPGGSLLASGSEDLTVRLWDVRTAQCLHVLHGHTNRVRSVAMSPDGCILASASEDQTIKVWDVDTGHCLTTFQGHTDQVRTVAFSPDGSLLASGSEDQTVRLWDVHTAHCLSVLPCSPHPIFSVVFSPDNKLLASGGDNQALQVWEVSSGHCLKTFVGHTKRVRSLAFSPDGQIVASGSEDQTIRLWNVDTGQCLNTLSGHMNSIFSVAFCSDGTILASGSEDQTLRLWDVQMGQCVRTLRGYTDQIRSIAFSPDGGSMASGSEDQTVRIWNTETGENLRTLHGHANRVRAVAFSFDGKHIASGSEDQTVCIWDIGTGRCVKTLRGHTNRVRTVAFSPESDIVASGSEDRTIRLWKISTGEHLITLQGHLNRVRSVAFSPNGRVLASGSEDQTIRVWEPHTGECLHILHGHTSWVWTIAFSPDGAYIASGSEDRAVCLWKREQSQQIWMFQEHEGRVRSVAFSPDSETIASGSEDYTIRLWQTSTGICTKVLQGHESWVWAVAFSPDGKTVASGSHDGTIKFWDVDTGHCLKTVRSERPYERMNIAQVTGLTPAQETMLTTLGAVAEGEVLYHT